MLYFAVTVGLLKHSFLPVHPIRARRTETHLMSSNVGLVLWNTQCFKAEYPYPCWDDYRSLGAFVG